MKAKVGVLVELENGGMKPANSGVITLVRNHNPDALYAIVINGDKNLVNNDLARFGIENVIHMSLPQNQSDNPDVRARAIIDAINYFEITSLFSLSTSKGKDILPRIAALMDAPLVMDCVDVDLEQSWARTSQYSGKTMATIKVTGAVTVFGVRPNVIDPRECPVQILSLDHDPGFIEAKGIRVVKTGEISEDADISLTEANVIVSGGRGMKNGENFDLIKTCARLVNGAAGASRVAVDSGWVPYAMQVGQTGEKVSPRVYLACGISGSIQHFAGMKTAGMIIAINTDENAAIVANCDYFAKADALELIPELNRILDHG